MNEIEIKEREAMLLDELKSFEEYVDSRKEQVLDRARVKQLQLHHIDALRAQAQICDRDFNRPEISQAGIWISACVALLNNPLSDLKIDECVEYADFILSEFNARFDTKTGKPNPEKFKFQID